MSFLEDKSHNRDVKTGLLFKFITCSWKTLLEFNIYQIIYKNSFTDLSESRYSYDNSITVIYTEHLLFVLLSILKI